MLGDDFDSAWSGTPDFLSIFYSVHFLAETDERVFTNSVAPAEAGQGLSLDSAGRASGCELIRFLFICSHLLFINFIIIKMR